MGRSVVYWDAENCSEMRGEPCTTTKRCSGAPGAVLFWLAVWQAAAMAIGQEVFLVSPVQALRCLLRLLPQADFWHRVGFSAGRILLGFGLGVVCSASLAVAR